MPRKASKLSNKSCSKHTPDLLVYAIVGIECMDSLGRGIYIQVGTGRNGYQDDSEESDDPLDETNGTNQSPMGEALSPEFGDNGDEARNDPEWCSGGEFSHHLNFTQTLNVWYIHLHLVNLFGKCISEYTIHGSYGIVFFFNDSICLYYIY